MKSEEIDKGFERPGYRYRFADAEFDELAGLLRVAGVAVDVEPRPLRLLGELLARPNEVVTKEELFDSVWDGRATVDHVLANAVSKLRAALGTQAASRLATVPRIGYRLDGPILRLEAAPRRTELSAGQPVPLREGFILERPLGRAPRSEVWLARHAKLDRKSVFKFANNAAELQSLKREYTLLRLLARELGPREDFVRILDTQFNSAPYFLECEYGGQNLLEWAQSDGALAAMGISQRIDLFIKIGDAVAAAHSVGVLHKDIKPANILIESKGSSLEVRLTDFGSGRLLKPERLAELRLTALGLTQDSVKAEDSRSGTYMYMAPELLAGNAPTVQSDVFSLGVLLYQLAIADLRRPLAPGWEREVADPLIALDITNATDGSCTQRIVAASELVHRLRRLESRHAELARAEEDAALVRAAKSAALRRRVQRPWIVFSLITLIAGLGTSSWFLFRTTAALNSETDARERADAIQQFLIKDLLTTPDLSSIETPKQSSLLDIVRRGSLAASERFKGRPLDEASARYHLARVFQRLWSMTDADNEFQIAIQLQRANAPENDPKLVEMQLWYALLLLDRRRVSQAKELHERVERSIDSGRVDASSEIGRLATRVRINVLFATGRGDEGASLARQFIKTLDASAVAPIEERGQARQDLARSLVWLGQDAEVEKWIAELRSPPFADEVSSSALLSRIAFDRAAREREAERYGNAQKILKEDLWRQMSSKRPSTWHLGYGFSELGHAYKMAESWQEAIEAYTRAIPFMIAALGEEHQFAKITAINIANTELKQHNYQRALQICMEHEPWFRDHFSEGKYGDLEYTKARALLALDRPLEALPHFQWLAKRVFLASVRDRSDNDLLIQAYVGVALVRSNQRAEGNRVLTEAREELLRRSAIDAGPAEWDQYLK